MLMLAIIVLLLCIMLKAAMDKGLVRLKKDYAGLQHKYDGLSLENNKLSQENKGLEAAAEETVELYNITKDICSSLDEDKVFKNFRAQIDRHIKIGDCKFIKYGADLTPYQDYAVLPLSIDKKPIGSLLTSGIGEEDKDKFNILSQQFLLGLKRAILYQQVQELTITDSLTGVFNRRFLMARLSEEVGRSRKFNYSFSFLMVDLDNFKEYNDRYGHLVGDAILREVADIIKQNIRQIDLLARYGGEEFSIILTETDKDEARPVAERIRQAVEEQPIKVYDESLKATLSIGISIFPLHAGDPVMLIDSADQALYRAKTSGRNRIYVYDDPQ